MRKFFCVPALGHKSTEVTLDVYGHLWPGEEDRVRDAIGRPFRSALDYGVFSMPFLRFVWWVVPWSVRQAVSRGTSAYKK